MIDAIKITKREAEVLKLVCKGLGNKEIANELDISQWTVGAHIKSLMSKSHCNNRVKLVLWAMKVGLCR